MGEGETSIVVMDANGQNQQRLTFEPGINSRPHWSPDGERIAFVSTRDGSRRIYTMDTNGQNVQQITHWQREFDGAPAWSPNGQWLAFGSGDERSWGIYLIDPQGRNETLIIRSEVNQLDGLAFACRPTWSPDSQHLIYVDPEIEDDVGLMKIRVDGGMPTHLNIEGLLDWAHPLWSPDGHSLLFSAFKSGWPSVVEGEIGLFLMNLDTSESHHFILPVIAELINKSDFSLLRLVWAPDNSQLMLSIGSIEITNQGEGRLYLIDIASETVRLWMENASEPDWVRPGFVYAVTPSGKRIATWAQIKTGGH
jgi:Tol biopolymer transport system component